MDKLKNYVPGLILVGIIAFLATLLNNSIKEWINLEPLTIAIIMGMFFTNILGVRETFKPGIQFSLKKLLKIGIVLLGFKLNFYALASLGPKALLLVLLYIPLALLLAVGIGRLFNMNNTLATLIGVGSSICGASAIVALAPCVNADEDDTIVAVSIVSFLGAVGVISYSAIAINTTIDVTQYGMWSGLSLHGVAHAIAAAFAMGNESGEIGTLVKMTRVLMIVPVSLVLAFIFNRNTTEDTQIKRASFPFYVLYFILAGGVNTLGILPQFISKILIEVSGICILMAITSMGLSANMKTILKKGTKGLTVGFILFLILSLGSLGAILYIL